MKEHRATHFDPELLDIFLDSEDHVTQIREQYDDYYPAAVSES